MGKYKKIWGKIFLKNLLFEDRGWGYGNFFGFYMWKIANRFFYWIFYGEKFFEKPTF